MAITSTEQVDFTKDIDQIVINVKTREAVVRVNITANNQSYNKKVRFDILEFLQDEGYTSAQITGIKNMFKQMMAKAYGIAVADLADDIFVVTEEPIEEV